jgi:hypothetical protein
MSLFRKILNFFSPPKKNTSMATVRSALKSSRKRSRDGSGRYVGDDPNIEENKAYKDED